MHVLSQHLAVADISDPDRHFGTVRFLRMPTSKKLPDPLREHLQRPFRAQQCLPSVLGTRRGALEQLHDLLLMPVLHELELHVDLLRKTSSF